MKKLLISFILLFLMTTQVMAKATYIENHDNSFVFIQHSSGNLMVLGWKCFDDELKMRITPSYLNENKPISANILYKFDNEPSSPDSEFHLSANQRQTYFKLDEISSFTQKSLSSNQVEIKINRLWNGEKPTAIFKLDGLGEALEKLQCAKHLL